MPLLTGVHVTKRTRRSLWGFLTFVIVLVLLLQGVGLKPFHSIQRSFSYAGTSIGSFFNHLRGYNAIFAENTKLNDQILSLGNDTAEIMKLREENRQLRSMLQFRNEEAPNTPTVFADVLTRSIGTQRAQITVNVGKRDGVEVGAAVMVEDGVLIGVVEEAKEYISVVRLISDHRSRVAAKVGFSDTIGIAEGARGSLLDFRFIPQGSELSVNDLVQTSGVEYGIPANLIIGLVTEVSENDTEPFKEATIEPLVDLRGYQAVAVVIPAT